MWISPPHHQLYSLEDPAPPPAELKTVCFLFAGFIGPSDVIPSLCGQFTQTEPKWQCSDRPALHSSSLKTLPHEEKKNKPLPHGSAAATAARWERERKKRKRNQCPAHTLHQLLSCRFTIQGSLQKPDMLRGERATRQRSTEWERRGGLAGRTDWDCFSSFSAARVDAIQPSWAEWKFMRKGGKEMVRRSDHASAEQRLPVR